MYSSFLYSIYISTEHIYTSHIYPPASIVIFSSFLSLPFQGLFYFSGSLYSLTRKKFLRKKTCQKKNFSFSQKKIFTFLEVPSEKKIIFYIGKIFFPPYILLRSVKTLTVGISYTRQNKLVRREYIYGAWGTRGKESGAYKKYGTYKETGVYKEYKTYQDLRRSGERSEHVV